MSEAIPFAALLDRFERAAMAYERLGKMTRDDEKTRQLRKATIAELADARAALVAALLSERKETIERCAAEVEARVAPGKMLSIHLAAAIRSLGRE